MNDTIINVIIPKTYANANGSCCNGSPIFIPYIPDIAAGMLIKIVNIVNILIVLFKLLVMIIE